MERAAKLFHVTEDPSLSAGLVVYRMREAPEILLLHPGGPFWSKNDEGSWSVFKGAAEPGDLLGCARREFTRDTALNAEGRFVALQPVAQKNGKLLHAFAVEADLDLDDFRSNAFSLEWPLGSGRSTTFPEVDRIAYFPLRAALRKILPYQWPLLLELAEMMGWRMSRRQRAPPA
jgi:predicted NUDIX family NTP pyrophosphohydrolase